MSDAIRALMQAFGKKLPGRLLELDAALRCARGGAPEAYQVAKRLAHKLHGTAGSYGYAQVSSAAGVLEAALERPEPDWTQIDAAYASVKSAILGCSQTGP
ncbi:MAG TPA: Hpt domain-containing protein [Polyangiaceae bacterium]|nr:Hpt domain-containing protein [Polyangiaceae bacterium]HMR75443.1 Hpt domain-containing protein [Polyangiaceae bacterium]